jgi:hypothetical protein
MTAMGDMPDLPSNITPFSPCQFKKPSFCPQKARYGPILKGKFNNNIPKFNYFPWPDPGLDRLIGRPLNKGFGV